MTIKKPSSILYLYVSLLTLSLLGCASDPTYWFKPSASTQDFEKDKYTCLRESQQQQASASISSGSGSADLHSETNWDLYDTCMNAHGWHLQKAAISKQTVVAPPPAQTAPAAAAKAEQQPPTPPKEDYRPCSADDIRAGKC